MLHRLPVLLDEFRKHKLQQLRAEGKPAEKIPAATTSMRQWLRVIGVTVVNEENQYLPGADSFQPQIRQNEINRCRDRLGVRIQPQQFVGRAVGTGSMRAHAEAVGNGLEILLLLVDAVPAAPPPGLMDERSMRGIHQSDDSVIHAARAFRRSGRRVLYLSLNVGTRGAGIGRSAALVNPAPAAAGLGNENPDEAVVFLAGIAAGVNAIDFELLVRSQRRNQLALSGVRVESPAVVAAFDLLAIELTAGKRHAAMRDRRRAARKAALAYPARWPTEISSSVAWWRLVAR